MTINKCSHAFGALQASGTSTVVEHLTHIPKFEGLNQVGGNVGCPFTSLSPKLDQR
jgi:hypothetical protein